MDKGELFNFEDKSLLDDAEVKNFASGNIWPAAKVARPQPRNQPCKQNGRLNFYPEAA